VYAPFRLAAARLHFPARSALAHLPPGLAARQAWSPALQGNPRWLAPAGQLFPGLACSGFSSAGFRSLRRQPFQQFCPSGRRQLILYAAVVSSRQKPARLVVMALAIGSQTIAFWLMRRSLHSVVSFQQIIAPLKRGSCFLTSRFAGRQQFSFYGLP